MNEIFIIGKIIDEINYNFIVNSKQNFARVDFKILYKKQVFNVCAYNNIADFCYRRLKENDLVLVNGSVDTNMVINVKYIAVL